MWATLVTFVLLGCFLIWIRAWLRGSKLAIGLGVGSALVLIVGPLLRPDIGFDHMPVWAPALPIAIIALSLFGFGVLAWFWGED